MEENKGTVNGTVGTTEGAVQAAPVATAPQAVNPPQVAATTNVAPQQAAKQPNWFKRHWKGLTAGVAGLAAAGASVFVAYKKGKNAGVASTVDYYQQQNGSPLDPNM